MIAPRTPPADWSSSVEKGWSHAKAFFRRRSPVVFFSNERFWETHGFVQRSLAYALAGEGIEVIWVDGAGWRQYTPVVPGRPASLTVKGGWQLPLRRFGPIKKASFRVQALSLRADLARGKQPFFWVFGGMEEELSELLPPADVYSVFDNPYANLPDGNLCRRARMIACQNRYAENLFGTRAREKTKLLLPPMDLPAETVGVPPALPKGFPKRVMGYVGAFLKEGLDFEFVEETLVQFPEWGLLLVGRTDEAGEQKVQKLSRFSNFHRVGWLPREQALSYWGAMDVAFFPYGEAMGQDGAFAVKALEALYYRKPVLSTEVPKTQDLDGLIHFAESVEELRDPLGKPETLESAPDEAFWKLAWEMSPKVHLTRVAEALA